MLIGDVMGRMPKSIDSVHPDAQKLAKRHGIHFPRWAGIEIKDSLTGSHRLQVGQTIAAAVDNNVGADRIDDLLRNLRLRRLRKDEATAAAGNDCR